MLDTSLPPPATPARAWTIRAHLLGLVLVVAAPLGALLAWSIYANAAMRPGSRPGIR